VNIAVVDHSTWAQGTEKDVCRMVCVGRVCHWPAGGLYAHNVDTALRPAVMLGSDTAIVAATVLLLLPLPPAEVEWSRLCFAYAMVWLMCINVG
jgi:hypothetical protein